MSMDAKAILIFIPLPLRSHLVSTVEMAKLIVGRDDGLAVTILLMKLPTNITSNTNTSPHPFINFLELRESKAAKSGRLSVVERHKGEAKDVVAEMIKSGGRVAGFVLDMFCTPMIDVANQLCIPSYILFPGGSSSLGLMLHLQTFKDDHGWDLNEFDGSDKEVSIPTCVNPVPAKVWPATVFGKGLDLLKFVRRYRETRGIIINTFLEFEPHAINSLSADHKLPPVYPVGPIIQGGREEEEEEEEEIKGWLDEQPDSSVVFLCFGTNGYFKREQVNEIAIALEQSGLRFLWSLRKPPPEGVMEFPGEYEDVEEALPKGFLERCGEKGKVTLGWVPQIGVLSHPAVGGFVSHCGWNSTLESVWWGVPMAAWPLDAEQQLNAFLLVKELEMAVEIKMDYVKNSDVIVGAETIKQAVELLMEPENKIRVKVKELQHKSRKAVEEGGSSYNFLSRLVDTIMGTIS